MDTVGTVWIAQRLGVTVPTVCRWARNGRLPTPTEGPRFAGVNDPYRWPRDIIEQWAAKREEMIGAAEVALLLGRSKNAINRWARQGLMPHPVRIGNRNAWPRQVIHQWAQSEFMIEEVAA